VKRILPATITISALVITLLTYFDRVFLALPVSFDWAIYLPNLRFLLVKLAVIVASFGLLLGLGNLLSVHLNNIFRRRPGWLYSFTLLAGMVGALLAIVGDWLFAPGQGLAQQGPGEWMMRLYRYILVPIQASLTALLPFFLAFAAYRTLRMHRTPGAVLGAVAFMATAIVVLLGQVPLTFLPGLDSVRDWIVRVPAMAGMRGIVLGVALGITATALRVLIGADRPSSD